MKYAYFSKKVGKENGFGQGGDVGDLDERVTTLESSITTLDTSVKKINDNLGIITVESQLVEMQPNVIVNGASLLLDKGIYLLKGVARIGTGMQNATLSLGFATAPTDIYITGGEYDISPSLITRAIANTEIFVEVTEPTTYYLNGIQTSTQSRQCGFKITSLKLK